MNKVFVLITFYPSAVVLSENSAPTRGARYIGEDSQCVYEYLNWGGVKHVVQRAMSQVAYYKSNNGISQMDWTVLDVANRREIRGSMDKIEPPPF